MNIITGSDGIVRCAWCGTDADYVHYHDLAQARVISSGLQRIRPSDASMTLVVQNKSGSLSELVWLFAPTHKQSVPKKLADL